MESLGGSADTSGMIKKLQYLLCDQSGATSIEYALIAGFLSILIIAGVNSIGTTVKGTFNSVANALQ
jgi:pilus assembly protein Flp/PilA